MKTPYEIAKSYRDTREIPGASHNPLIIKWFGEVGHAWVQDDETAWCAAFVGAMLEEAGLKSTRKLNARSYLDWGKVVDPKDALPGDIAIFSRGDPKGWQGHVAFFEMIRPNGIQVFGGNQRDAVNSAVYSKDRLLGIRRVPGLHRPPARPLQPADGPIGLIRSIIRGWHGGRG